LKGAIKGISFLLLFIQYLASGQTIPYENGAFNAGLIFNMGSVTQRIGMYVGGFYALEHIQFNSTIRVFYNFASFGPSIRGWELQPSIGAVAAFGNPQYKEKEPFFSALGNQTGRKYSIGYSYNFYFDQIGTSQQTGTILIGVGRFSLITENDILATRRSDRFRTGAVKFSYWNGDFAYSFSTLLWTGNPQSPGARKIRDTDFPSRFGYMDISEAPYGKFSNGICSLQVKYTLGYGQEVQGGFGIDSETVRDIFQNKMIHDMYFWPKKWNKARNPHLPMLDEHGAPYLYKQDQKIKPSTVYFDISLNPSLFY
jgi:hypothetical protein